MPDPGIYKKVLAQLPEQDREDLMEFFTQSLIVELNEGFSRGLRAGRQVHTVEGSRAEQTEYISIRCP